MQRLFNGRCQMDWISVKDALPPNQDKQYIVYHGGCRKEIGICWWLTRYKKNKGLYWSWVPAPMFPAKDITHWMEIPDVTCFKED